MNKPTISERFDIDDIRAIRDWNSLRHTGMTPAEIVSDSSAEDEVGINNTVTLYFEEDDEEQVCKIVTSIRGNSLENRISNESPLGKAIMGHKAGDRVNVRVSDDYSFYVVIRSIDKTTAEDDEIKKF